MPGVFVGVCLDDFGTGLLLDLLTVEGGEVGDGHVDITWEGVEARGDHG